MKLIRSIEEAHEYCKKLKQDGKTIATINSGGDLHEGHMSLVKIAKDNADIVIMMVDHPIEFVGKKDRFKKFSKNYEDNILNNDITLCERNKVDIFFSPSMWDMYEDVVTKVNLVNPYTKSLEELPESHRNLLVSPYHMLSYIKDFNILMTDITMLGQKDIYQTMSVISMIKDFNLNIKPIIVPIARDEDGLPSSSSNRSLTEGQRKRAVYLCKKLQEVTKWSSYKSIKEIKNYLLKAIENSRSDVSCVNIYDFKTGKNIDMIVDDMIIIVIGVFGDLHYIDNVMVKPK
mgnify:CR=1 FL=1|tara:strand:- start:936 stop:1802 length:867 start_codon:yes stop_codon:yes gene_type:complete